MTSDRRPILAALLALPMAACGSTTTAAPPTPDASTSTDVSEVSDVSTVTDASAVPDARDVTDASTVPDVPFRVAEHDPLYVIPSQGGAVLAHPKLVVITYDEDTNREALEAHARWMVRSSWLHAVGDEYGVGEGEVVGTVHLSERAPDVINDREVQTFLAAGIESDRWPVSPGGSGETLYMVYFPARTVVTQGGRGGQPLQRSCEAFGGYHYEAASLTRGRFSYAVLPACPVPAAFAALTELEVIEHAASHELIEAATNPRPVTAPAWAYAPASLSPWTAIGPEVADLCSLSLNVYREGMFVAERSWSNRAAMAGDRDPCVPADPAAPYYYASASPDGTVFVGAGETAEFTLRGFSTAPGAPWTLRATSTGSFTPRVEFSPATMNNGTTATVRITPPATARSNTYALTYVYVGRSQTDYRVIPLVVAVQ